MSEWNTIKDDQSNYDMLLLPSPELPPAQVLRDRCENHNLQLINIIGNRICACPNGCTYSYPSLKLLLGV